MLSSFSDRRNMVTNRKLSLGKKRTARRVGRLAPRDSRGGRVRRTSGTLRFVQGSDTSAQRTFGVDFVEVSVREANYK